MALDLLTPPCVSQQRGPGSQPREPPAPPRPAPGLSHTPVLGPSPTFLEGAPASTRAPSKFYPLGSCWRDLSEHAMTMSLPRGDPTELPFPRLRGCHSLGVSAQSEAPIQGPGAGDPLCGGGTGWSGAQALLGSSSPRSRGPLAHGFLAPGGGGDRDWPPGQPCSLGHQSLRKRPQDTQPGWVPRASPGTVHR